MVRTTSVAAGILILICIICIVPALADPPSGYWAPWVTKTNTTSATINWWQDSAGKDWTVKYANASYYDAHGDFDHIVPDPDLANYHHVLLTGLNPNTTYKYLVEPSDKNTIFAVRKFQTFPVSGPFTFIVISDSHASEHRFKYVGDAINNEQGVLFILHGGDYSERDNASEWTDFFDYGDGMLANSSIYTNIGNHEYHNITSDDGPPTDAYQYRNSFDNPLNYSFDCAGVRFVVLDSPDPNNANGDDPQPSLALSESQASWLKDQLDNTMSGTFVIDHHPVWSYGNASPDPALQPWESLFHEYPISADFGGHHHCYQRLSVGGIPYFVVGNAGGKFDNMTAGEPYPPGYVWGKTFYLGYLKVTVDPENNRATANEYFAACVTAWDSETAASVFNPPILADTITFPLKTNLPTPTPAYHSRQAVSGGQPEKSGVSGYTGPAPTNAVSNPAPALSPAVLHTLEPATEPTSTLPPLPANTPRSGLDEVPVIGALGLCGVIFLFRQNGN